jgi:glycosyltransferase involved in cell wall biosynthesis
VRALVNAGVPVQWIPIDWEGFGARSTGWALPDARPRPILAHCGTRGHLADLAVLVERTSRAIDHEIVIIHAPPEYWPARVEPGRLNVGYAAWETSLAPAHWLPIMRQMDRVLVPCRQNAEAFARSRLDRAVTVVPHVRRHCWCEHTLGDVAAARGDLGIAPDHTVFYTIGAWDPRKAVPDLIEAFCQAFGEADRVALLIKTNKTGHASGPVYERRPTRDLATQAITEATQKLRRQPPLVVLHDEEISGDDIDLVHAVGDVYVSLSHGEGWSLGAFEAATLAKPVIMTGWGGQTDFLGRDWPGSVPYRMAPAPLWPPEKPSYSPSQRWAQADIAAAANLLRALIADPAAARHEAQRIRERIVREYAEPVVVNRLLEALA